MKYCPEIIKEISGYIVDGYNQHDAAIMAGISEALFYEWMKNKIEFIEAIKKAHAEYKHEHLQIIRKAATNGSWQASAWLLERRYKDEFALRQENTGADGKVIKVTVEK